MFARNIYIYSSLLARTYTLARLSPNDSHVPRIKGREFSREFVTRDTSDARTRGGN